MPRQLLGRGEGLDQRADVGEGAGGVVDDVHRAHERAHGEARGVARAAGRGQDMGGACGVVPERDRRVVADEDRARVADAGRDGAGVGRLDLQVLGGVGVRDVDGLVSWASDIKEYALQQAVNGKEWTGWKLIEGRSNRKYTDETAVANTISQAGFDPYERSVRGVTAMQKLIGNLVNNGLAYKAGSTPIPAELYELFPVLKQMLHRRGGDLSGGQQQQLAIARALAAGPKLLILDEPTEGIQPSIIKDIGRVIRMLADRGTMAILLCEQYYDFAEELADDYVVMERGEVIARGKGEDMQANEVRKLVAI